MPACESNVPSVCTHPHMLWGATTLSKHDSRSGLHTGSSGYQGPFQPRPALLVLFGSQQQLAVAVPHVQLRAEDRVVTHPGAAERDDSASYRVEDLFPDLQQYQLVSCNSSAATAVAAQHLRSYIATGQLGSQVTALLQATVAAC